MGTRGFIGFVVDGVEKITYNHWDSYPSGLGASMLKWLHEQAADHEALGLEGTRLRASLLTMVTDETPITPEVLEKCKKWANTDVGGRSESITWYQLLRETQGDPEATLEAGYAEDNKEFAFDSVFCEWGYLVDFDANTFEVYEGFQDEPPTEGRWATPERLAEEAEMYREQIERNPRLAAHPRAYAVNRVASWSLLDLPSEEDVLALEERQNA